MIPTPTPKYEVDNMNEDIEYLQNVAGLLGGTANDDKRNALYRTYNILPPSEHPVFVEVNGDISVETAIRAVLGTNRS